ncbi:hypothetical protein STEG23_020684, partial [Scotinomys teguina]
ASSILFLGDVCIRGRSSRKTKGYKEGSPQKFCLLTEVALFQWVNPLNNYL